MTNGESVNRPPEYCQYAQGPCPEDIEEAENQTIFFVYASSPAEIVAPIESAIDRLRRSNTDWNWRSWRDLNIQGRIIFCQICKAIRTAATVVADVTTLNFNLLFEIGYSIGLGVPVVPIRDTTYTVDKRSFEELGLLDTLGYLDFRNSEELEKLLSTRCPSSAIPDQRESPFPETPLYFIKGQMNTEGAVRLMSTLKKSALRFRTYDPLETPRLSLYEAHRQIAGSVGVVAHLLSPNRCESKKHNALCAMLCGMAMAKEKAVAMLQEGSIEQPIDYRDVVRPYDVPGLIPALLEPFIRQVVFGLQSKTSAVRRLTAERLETIDLGDPAAENEIGGLRSYFVRTGQFAQARRGHARLVVGRKGTGKTAIFYGIRNSLKRGHSNLVLDLKPEGHQFTKLREAVLSKMSPGLREHTMTAFWTYILLCELLRKILDVDITYSQYDPGRSELYYRVKTAYQAHNPGVDADFSQRLLLQVNRIVGELDQENLFDVGPRVTQLLYGGDIPELGEVAADYLEEKDAVWLLFDNLDKGWPTRGTTSEDIVIARSLLDATRKLQRQLETRGVELNCLVFLRTDIYEHLMRETSDKGKDTVIRLDWDDPEVFQEIVKARIQASTDLTGGFRDIWPALFESHIGPVDSFAYIVERTMMRPRDLLMFLQRAIEVALNRGHEIVTADDIRQAESSYSEDIVLLTGFEIEDTYPKYRNMLYAFQSAPREMSMQEVENRLSGAGIQREDLSEASQLLLWFSFLGAVGMHGSDETYSYMVRYNLRHLLHHIENGRARVVVHPAFRTALGIADGGS